MTQVGGVRLFPCKSDHPCGGGFTTRLLVALAFSMRRWKFTCHCVIEMSLLVRNVNNMSAEPWCLVKSLYLNMYIRIRQKPRAQSQSSDVKSGTTLSCVCSVHPILKHVYLYHTFVSTVARNSISIHSQYNHQNANQRFASLSSATIVITLSTRIDNPCGRRSCCVLWWQCGK